MAAKGKKGVNRLGMTAVCLVLAAFTCILSVKTIQLKEKQKQYQSKIQLLQAQIEKEEDYAVQLEEERLYVQTKQYVEKTAREKLGLANADELLIKPKDQ